jgi:hypothetical protein
MEMEMELHRGGLMAISICFALLYAPSVHLG